ncbi:MAG: hypothetical protein FJY07_03610 [Bacteroidetes bacterium]|nr:hypothetical protein [Bacteroidota bacterium]
MEKFRDIKEAETETQVKNAYFIVKNEEFGFYWVLNLENHPNSFLLDKTFQHFVPSTFKENQESMVVFQPTQ